MATFTGTSGDNTILGSTGADTLIGLAGNDTYVVNHVLDVLIEQVNGGIDTVFSSVSYSLSAHVENLTLTGTLAVNATGNSQDNILIGNNAANILNGGAGADDMAGGHGNDTYVVDNVGDVVTEGANQGTDTVRSSISYALGANVEKLTLTGTSAINATGNGQNNVLIGNNAANILDGGAGADNMAGGVGEDTYVVDDLGDIVTENSSQGTDTVLSSINYVLGNNVEKLVLTGSAVEGTGNSLNNTITGNAADNTIDGGRGADSMAGGAGHDTYVVDNLRDSVTEGLNQGTDTVESSVSYELGTNVENLILTNASAFPGLGIGNSLDNVIVGNSGLNILAGRAGNDSITGNGGLDYIDGGSGVDIALYSGNFLDYDITPFSLALGLVGYHRARDASDDRISEACNPGPLVLSGVIVTDLRGGAPDGKDYVRNVEVLQFNDHQIYLDGRNNPALLGADVRSLTETNLAADISASGALTIVDFDGDETFVAQAGTVGSYGTFAIDAAGAWTYTAASAHDEFVAGTSYTDIFGVTSADGTATSVTINILGTNDAAVLSSDIRNLIEGTTAAAISASGTLTVSDVDSPATFVAQAGTAGTYGTFAIDAAGAWTYTASSAHDEFVDGTTYTDSFAVASADGTATSVTINILGTDHAPVLTVDTSGEVIEDAAAPTLGDTGTLSFTDVDVTDTHTVSVAYNDNASWTGGSLSAVQIMAITSGFSVDSNSWDYSVANAALQFLGNGEAITLSFDVTVTDDSGAVNDSDTETVTLTLTGANDAPVIVGETGGAVSEYASTILGFSSQFSSTSWSAAQVLGAPNTFAYGDTPTAWSALNPNGPPSPEFVSVGFATPVFASQVVIRETNGNGFVSQVDLVDLNGVLHTVWTGVDPSLPGSPVDFAINFAQTDYLVKGVKVYTNPTHDLSTWEEIDSIQLSGSLAMGGAVTEQVIPAGNLTNSGTIAFTDVDLTDIHSLSSVTPSAGALGALTASVSTDTTGTGLGGVVTWNYSVAAADVEYLAKDQHKIDTFSFNVLDGQGGSVARTVSVDITGTNDAPVVASAAVVSEYASTILDFSSQFSSTSWSAAQVLGAPNTFAYGDTPTAWSALNSNGPPSPEFVSVGFATPVFASQVVIRETNGNGFVSQVDVVDVNDVLHTVWMDVDPSLPGSPVDFTIDFAQTDYLVKGVKVYTNPTHDLSTWEEIDSIQLSGAATDGAVTEQVTPAGNLTDSGTIAFTDADLTDIHSLSAVTPSAGALGTLTASVGTDTTGTGLGGVVTWNYSVAATAVEFLAAGQIKLENFSFNVLDGNGGSVARTVSVAITGTDEPLSGMSANNNLSVNLVEVLDQPDATSELFVKGDVGDSVDLVDGGWNNPGLENHGGIDYVPYVNMLGSLLVEQDVTVL